MSAPASPGVALSVVDGIMAILAADSAVGALVGGTGDAARIGVDLPERATFPAVLAQQISNPRFADTHDNATTGTLRRTRVQLTCLGGPFPDGYLDAVETAAAVMAALADWTGTIAGRRVGRIRIEDDLDNYDPATGWNSVIVDVIVTNDGDF